MARKHDLGSTVLDRWPPATYEEATSREWLVTNGIGGFAGSTICGANTRRYHGLFIPSLTPPTSRVVMVSKVDETVETGQGITELGTNHFPGAIHPDGYKHLASFARMPLPESVFAVGEARLRKTVWMRYGLNVSVVRYENVGDTAFGLSVRPMLVCRDYHHLQRKDTDMPFTVHQAGPDMLRVAPGPGCRDMWMRHTKGSFSHLNDWYRAFRYDKETYRGLDDQEDALCIGEFRAVLAPGEPLFLVFSLSREEAAGDPEAWHGEEINRLKAIPPAGLKDAFVRDLCISGDQFIVARGPGQTILAGYPWFTDWGRDTMIAMRGLVIGLGRKKLAKSIFRTFLAWTDRGMIPNRFPDNGEIPEYNTIDATLWLLIALYEYVERFDDLAFVREVLPFLEEIIDQHAGGTRYGIGLTPEGLLGGGAEGVQLTWMDAMVDGHVVTPRRGCPVEINALWYNALCILHEFKKRTGHAVAGLEKLIRHTRRAFRANFIHPDGYLYDVVIPGKEPDRSIRPNMIYAVSLPFCPLRKKEAQSVLACVEEHLYTDYGLRSLDPANPDFKPDYGGNAWMRDHAYHQGTVWTFLWGEWALAFLRVNQYSAKSRREVLKRTDAWKDHFYQRDGLCAISEIFDGLAPGQGRGCVQQAWSVGMLLRVLTGHEIGMLPWQGKH